MKKYIANPYGSEVFFTQDARQFKRKAGFAVEDAAGITHWDENGTAIIVYVGDGLLETLVHECCHATLFVLQRVGIDPSCGNGEPMAYLMDSMFACFKNVFKEYHEEDFGKPDGGSFDGGAVRL